MLPTINGKQIIDCSLEDLKEIIDNQAYRENEYIDYKQCFHIDETEKKSEERDKAIAEFRNDICSFANSYGGYLIYGVNEKKGIPVDICGITLKDNNADQFERNIKNYIQTISPCPPHIQIRFISMQDERFVVVIYIKHDHFSPYIHITDNRNYMIYKRVGNSKQIIPYQEIRQMFTQSLAIENEIVNFRNNRVDYFRLHRKNIPQFMLLHIIPETFLDTSYKKLMYIENMRNGMLYGIFSVFDCDTITPSVEGIRFLNNQQKDAECRFFNNGIAECFYKSYNYNMAKMTGVKSWNYNQLDVIDIWEKTSFVINMYSQTIKHYLDCNRAYICLTIVGCEGLVTGKSNMMRSKVDRHVLMCEPVIIDNLNDKKIVERQIKQLHLEYYLSLGICNNEEFKKLVNELYA